MALCRTVGEKQYRAQGLVLVRHIGTLGWSWGLGVQPCAHSRFAAWFDVSFSCHVCLKSANFGAQGGVDWAWLWKQSLSSFSAQTFMEEVKSRGPFIYSVLESAQAFLAQHPFQEPEESLTDGKGLAHVTLGANRQSHVSDAVTVEGKQLSRLITQGVCAQINTQQNWFSALWCVVQKTAYHLGNTPLIYGSHCLFISSPWRTKAVISLLFIPLFQTSSPVGPVSFLLFTSSSVPLFHHSHGSPQLLLCDFSFFLLLLPLPPHRRVSAQAHPKHQPLRVETGQRGQRPVGEADCTLCRPPQVRRLNHVSSRTGARSALRRFNCLGFLIRLHGYCFRSVSNSTAGKPGNSSFHLNTAGTDVHFTVTCFIGGKLSPLFFFLF